MQIYKIEIAHLISSNARERNKATEICIEKWGSRIGNILKSRYSFFWTKAGLDAETIIHEGILKLAENPSTFENKEEDTFFKLLCKACRSVCDKVRNSVGRDNEINQAQTSSEESQSIRTQINDMLIDSKNPEDMLILKETQKVLDKYVKSLPYKQAVIAQIYLEHGTETYKTEVKKIFPKMLDNAIEKNLHTIRKKIMTVFHYLFTYFLLIFATW